MHACPSYGTCTTAVAVEPIILNTGRPMKASGASHSPRVHLRKRVRAWCCTTRNAQSAGGFNTHVAKNYSRLWGPMSHSMAICHLQKGMPVIACVTWAPAMRLKPVGKCADRRNGRGRVSRQIVPARSSVLPNVPLSASARARLRPGPGEAGTGCIVHVWGSHLWGAGLPSSECGGSRVKQQCGAISQTHQRNRHREWERANTVGKGKALTRAKSHK